jgi:hypothetical protein
LLRVGCFASRFQGIDLSGRFLSLGPNPIHEFPDPGGWCLIDGKTGGLRLVSTSLEAVILREAMGDGEFVSTRSGQRMNARTGKVSDLPMGVVRLKRFCASIRGENTSVFKADGLNPGLRR